MTELAFDGFHLTAPDGWHIEPQDSHLPILMLSPASMADGDRPDWVVVVGIEKLYPEPDSLSTTVARSAALFDAVLTSMHPVMLAHGAGLAGVFEAGAAQVGVVAFRRHAVPGRFDPRSLDFVVMVYETGMVNDDAFVPTRTAYALIAEATRVADGFTVDG